jgi:hypothetical protein
MGMASLVLASVVTDGGLEVTARWADLAGLVGDLGLIAVLGLVGDEGEIEVRVTTTLFLGVDGLDGVAWRCRERRRCSRDR